MFSKQKDPIHHPPSTDHSRISLAIIDGDMFVRQTLTEIFTQTTDIQVASTLDNAEEAVHYIQHNPVDVALMDIHLPGISGIKATSIIRHHYPQVRVLIMASAASRNSIDTAMTAGATGYLLKNTRTSQLIAAIRAVVQDLSVFSPDLLNQILPNRHHTMRTANELAITQKELMVLHYLNRGLRNADIEAYSQTAWRPVKPLVRVHLRKAVNKPHCRQNLRLRLQRQNIYPLPTEKTRS